MFRFGSITLVIFAFGVLGFAEVPPHSANGAVVTSPVVVRAGVPVYLPPPRPVRPLTLNERLMLELNSGRRISKANFPTARDMEQFALFARVSSIDLDAELRGAPLSKIGLNILRRKEQLRLQDLRAAAVRARRPMAWLFQDCLTVADCTTVFVNGQFCQSQGIGARRECVARPATPACYCWE